MTEITTTPAEQTPTTTATPPVTGGNANVEAKFTQADLDRIASDTRAKATEAARKKVLAELGIEDPDADKALLADARKRKADEQTATEKETVAREKAEKRAAELESTLETERANRLSERRDDKLKDALMSAKVKPEKVKSVLTLLSVEQADALTAAIKEGGMIDDKALVKIAEEAKKEYPEWFGNAGPGSPSLQNGRVPQGTPPKVKTSGHL